MIFILKKLLFYNPDKNNDQEKAYLPEFTRLVLDLHLVEKHIRNREFAKNLRQSNLKGKEDKNKRSTMRNPTNQRASKYPQNMRKTMGSLRETIVNAMLGKGRGLKEKDEIMENENNIEEDNFQRKSC